jgi:hypothetical protein
MTPPGWLLGQDQPQQELFLLGDDFMPWMVLAFGAALVAGNLLALVRPPRRGPADPDSTIPDDAIPDDVGTGRPPLARTFVMITVGAVASAWGLASLLS